MQLGAVLDTVIGISFVFFLLALASSAVAEWLATVFKKRAKYLLRGLRDMLDESAPADVRELPDKIVDRLVAAVGRAGNWRNWMPFARGVSQERAMHRQAQRLISPAHRRTARDAVLDSLLPAAPAGPGVEPERVPAPAVPAVEDAAAAAAAALHDSHAAAAALSAAITEPAPAEPGPAEPGPAEPAPAEPAPAEPEPAPAETAGGALRQWRAKQRQNLAQPARATRNAAFPAISPGMQLVLTHPLVASQAHVRTTGEVSRLPAYVDARTFAAVILDALTPNGAGAATSLCVLATRVRESNLPGPLKDALLAATTTGQKTLDEVRNDLERWYDATMERVSGAYKRWIKRWLVIIAAVFVLVLHVDTLQVASTLYTDPAVRQAAASIGESTTCKDKAGAEAKTCLTAARTALVAAGLPIGPPEGCSVDDLTQAPWRSSWWTAVGTCLLGQKSGTEVDTGRAPLTVLGLALTILATTFGAPFWFQLLTRAASLRNTGKRPEPEAEPQPTRAAG